MNKGDKVKLSQLRVNDCGRLDGKAFIVTERVIGSGGHIKVMYANGSDRTFNIGTEFLGYGIGGTTYIKLNDQEVEFLGVGSVSVTIKFPLDS